MKVVYWTIKQLCKDVLCKLLKSCAYTYSAIENTSQPNQTPPKNQKPITKNPNKKKYKSHQCFLCQSNAFVLDLPNTKVGLGTGGQGGQWVGREPI